MQSLPQVSRGEEQRFNGRVMDVELRSAHAINRVLVPLGKLAVALDTRAIIESHMKRQPVAVSFEAFDEWAKTSLEVGVCAGLVALRIDIAQVGANQYDSLQSSRKPPGSQELEDAAGDRQVSGRKLEMF